MEAQGFQRLLLLYELNVHYYYYSEVGQLVPRLQAEADIIQMMPHLQLLILIMISRAGIFNRLAAFRFSSTASAQLSDWEYTTRVQQSLHQNDINEALKYLINSYFDGRVLDVHIFRNFYLKAEKLKADITYQELGYQLYRHHFKPNLLILEWMTTLTTSTNQNIIKLLTEDFKSLKIQMSKPHKTQDPKQAMPPVKVAQQNPTEKVRTPPKPESPALKEDQAEGARLERIEAKRSPTDMQMEEVPLKMQREIKNFFYSLAELKPTVILHNVEIETEVERLDDGEQQFENELDKEERQEEEEEEEEEEIEYLQRALINKIKVERIEISFSNQLQNDGLSDRKK